MNGNALLGVRKMESKYDFRERVSNSFAYITQYISFPFFFALFNLFFNIKIYGKDNLIKVTPPFVLVANHFSFFDSFLFRIVFDGSPCYLPLRFMAVRKFNSFYLNILYRVGIIPLVYWVFGVFTIVPGAGLEKNLEKPELIMRNGGNVVIYPEGRINKEGGVGIFKKGAVSLALRTGYPILPVIFVVSKTRKWRKTINISIGNPTTMSDGRTVEQMNSTLRGNMEEMIQRIPND